MYSCTVDAPPLLQYEALIWALTLCHLGGCRPDQIVIHAVEGTDPTYLAQLRDLGIRVVGVRRFDERNRFANKLAQLKSDALADSEVAVLCDCDLAFAGEITGHLDGTGIGARIVDLGIPPYHEFLRLARLAGLTGALPMARSAQMLRWTHRYNINAGLVIVPKALLPTVADSSAMVA